MAFGITVKQDTGGKRIEMECTHQNGLLYVVPSESSWVCTQEFLDAHALAGFFREMVALQDPQVKALMQKWGVYYRARPLKSEESEDKAHASS